MKIVVNRLWQDLSTISTVEINNMLRFYGMEPANPIPAGIYNVIKYKSPRFKKYMALVDKVPGHEGIEIHVGNYPISTKNCLLLGAGYMTDNFISSSQIAVDQFYKEFFAAVDNGEKVTITYIYRYGKG